MRRHHYYCDDPRVMELVQELLEREFERMSPRCPRCRQKMVKRINGQTKRPFWGCPDFPECGGTRFLRRARRRDLVDVGLKSVRAMVADHQVAYVDVGDE